MRQALESSHEVYECKSINKFMISQMHLNEKNKGKNMLAWNNVKSVTVPAQKGNVPTRNSKNKNLICSLFA